MKEIVIVAGKRTPMGEYGGALRNMMALELGAIAGKALSHPLGANGTRLVMTLLYELKRRKKRYGLASACIGGGHGITIIVEAA